MAKSRLVPAVLIRSSYAAEDAGSGSLTVVSRRWVTVKTVGGFRVLRSVNMVSCKLVISVSG